MPTMRSLFLFALPILLMACAEKPKSEAPQRPNILFAIADDASYPHFGAYGCKWVKTPGFDRVAENGLLFTRAYTPNAKCAPSRSCILTGRNSWQLEEAANHWPYFPDKFKTYAEVLATKGYHVGKTGKGWGPGKRSVVDGYPRRLAGIPYDSIKTEPSTSKMSKTDYAANFKHFLEQQPEPGQPWCFWYGGFEPHRAYEYESGRLKGNKKLEDIDEVPPFWPDNEQVRNDLLDYAFEIEYFDQHLVKMLDHLEAIGELDNTIIVVTADNGMPFPRVKGQKYEWSNHLPLAISWGKGIQNPGRRVDDYVSFIDFAPTFLEFAGISLEHSGMQAIQGQSLGPLFLSDQSGIIDPERNRVLIGKERHDVGRPEDLGYPVRGIVKDNFLYIYNYEPDRWPSGNPSTGYLNCDGSPTKTEILQMRRDGTSAYFWQLAFGRRAQEELYDLSKDVYCMTNLASNPEFETTREAFQQELFEALKEQGDPRQFGQQELFDSYKYTDTTSINFFERYHTGETLNAGWVSPTDFEKGFEED